MPALSMRRLLAFLLTLVLVLQSTWTAAAAVCQHEPATQQAHFGHHVDLQAPDQVHPDAASPAGPDMPHLDCIGCHALCAALAERPAFLPAPLLAREHATPYRRSVTQGVPERLLRPPHTVLV